MENLNLQSIYQSNKQQLDTLIDVMVNEAEGSELQSYILAKKLQYVADTLQSIMHDKAMADAERNKGTQVSFAEIQVKETGVKYDYSNTGYYPYLEKLAEKKEIEMTIKEHESFLKAIKKPETVINQETGEFMDIVPPVKTSKSSIIISLK